MVHALLLLAAVRQPAPTVAMVTIQPAEVAITVGDSVKLAAVAVDAAGKPVRDVTVRWFQDDGRFEGNVDSVTGVVQAGSVGTLSVSALVAPRRGGSPVTGFARVTILPRATSRIAIEPWVTRLYEGQSAAVTAVPYSPDGDRRHLAPGMARTVLGQGPSLRSG